MAVNIKEAGSVAGVEVLEIGGQLDGVGAPEIEKRCLAILGAPGARLVLDFSGLDYISSAGLRSLLVLAKKARAAGGGFAICNPAPMVREVMEISGFDKLLRLTDSREAAIAAAG
jgi:anti-anti-sigma factor